MSTDIPTDEQLWQAWELPEYEALSKQDTINQLRAVLARWGRTTPHPIPVSERLPGAEECTTNPRNGQGQWCWGWVQHDPIPYSGRWRMMRREWLADEAVAWLPSYTLPLPSREVGRD
jgi:hypothetical protein